MMKPNFARNNYWFIIVAIFCLDLVVFISELGSIATLKSIVLAYSFICYYIVLKYCDTFRLKHTDYIWYLLYLFILFLTVRLIVDFAIKGYTLFLYKSILTLFFIYFSTIVLPLLFFSRYMVKIPILKLAWTIGVLLAVCLSYSVFNIFSGKGIITTGGQISAKGIDIIYFGHLGTSLFIVGLFLLRQAKDMIRLLLCIVFVIIGILCVSFSGERGPFVALIVCTIVYLLIQNKWSASKVVLTAIVVITFVKLLPQLVLLLHKQLLKINISSLYKISVFISGGVEKSGNDRVPIYDNGLDIISDNPFLGFSYLMPNQSYVHNIFIESFMATGIIGGLFFMIINIRVLQFGYKLSRLNNVYTLFYLLFIQYLIYGFVSRTLIALPQYWLMMVLVLSCYEYAKSE